MNSYKLKDLLSIKNGKDHKELNDGNIPVFGSGGIMRYGDKALFEDESILLPRKGTLSNIQYVNEPFWTVDTIYYSVVNKKLANPFYLFNYLKSLDLSNLNSGTGVPSMTFNSYYDLHIKLPVLSTQKSIAKILSDLDTKIELNNRINRELEAMAKTLYDYWFVQFDFPVASSASATGEVQPEQGEVAERSRSYKSSGGKMVYNAELKREIPEGWEVKKLAELIIKYTDKSIHIESKSILNKGKYPVITQDNGDFISGFTNEENPIKDVPLIIFGDHSCTLRYIDFSFFRGADGTQIMSFGNDLNIYVYMYLQSIIKQIPGYGKYERHFKYLKEFDVIVPESQYFRNFQLISKPIFDKISQSRIENQQLSELRDWLLPMLMNGQVTVKEAEVNLSMEAEPSVEYKKGSITYCVGK